MSAFIGIDPDSTHPAGCVLVDGVVAELLGGGSRKDGAELATARGAIALLERYSGARVAVERQQRGPWSESCEGVAIVHGIWVAACELVGVPYTGVRPVQWIRPWIQLCEYTGQPRGSEKPYYAATKARFPGLVKNEDQAASAGIAAWLAHLHGESLRLDSAA